MLRYLIIPAFILITSVCSAQDARDEFYRKLNTIRKNNFKRKINRDLSLEKESESYLRKMLLLYKGKLVHDKFTTRYEVITTCDDALECWMDSKPHRRILMRRRVKKIGVAFVDGYALARLK